MRHPSFYILVFLVQLSCKPAPSSLSVQNHELELPDCTVKVQPLCCQDGFKVLLVDRSGKLLDQKAFKHQFYRLDTGDIDGNGSTNVLLGVIKETEFDKSMKRRLFILRIDEGKLRPLWLGSRVCQELIDFRTTSNGMVRTLERTPRGTYAIGMYYWDNFGLTLLDYSHQNLPYDKATHILAEG